jgi:hypothetical protein
LFLRHESVVANQRMQKKKNLELVWQTSRKISMGKKWQKVVMNQRLTENSKS